MRHSWHKLCFYLAKLFNPNHPKVTMNSLQYPIQGDKANSPWFNEFLVKLLEERDRIGLTDIIRQIDALIINVESGCSVSYVSELALMTPYHYLVTLESESYWTHVLRIDMNSPDILIREVRNLNTHGIFRSLNEVYPIGAHKPNSRYMGEIFRVTNLHEVVEIQKSREIRFFNQDQIRKLELPGNMAIVKPSPYTLSLIHI